MRAQSSKVAIYTLIVALATPATVAFAAGPGDDPTRGKSGKVSTVGAAETAPEATVVTSILAKGRETTVFSADGTLRKAIARAAAQATPQTGRAGTSRPPAKGVRAQYGGGGGIGQTITMVLSTVVGLAATMYMLKYLKNQQNKAEVE